MSLDMPGIVCKTMNRMQQQLYSIILLLLQFVATRIKPVLRKAREGEFVNIVKETGEYLSGLWSRLNGGGSRLIEPPLSPDLPLPLSTKAETELVRRRSTEYQFRGSCY
jgi:hypothetical protein